MNGFANRPVEGIETGAALLKWYPEQRKIVVHPLARYLPQRIGRMFNAPFHIEGDPFTSRYTTPLLRELGVQAGVDLMPAILDDIQRPGAKA